MVFMPKKNLLYMSAQDCNGKLVTAAFAEKGASYSCPICNGVMTLCKSGNIGPGSRRPYFRHKALSSNCTPEGVLHHTFKMMLAETLENSIQNGEPFEVKWTCKFCGEEHVANLLKVARKVEVEKDLVVCQPDILLLTAEEKPILAIEVVVSHEPEPKVLEYYKKNRIALYQINICSEDDLVDVSERAKLPVVFDFCSKIPRCKQCGSYFEEEHLAIVDWQCYKCHENFKAAVILIGLGRKNEPYDVVTPKNFSENEMLLAKSKGVIIEKRYSKTMNESYFANICPHCKSMVDDYFISDELFNLVYDLQAKKECGVKTYRIGYYCHTCNTFVPSKE